MADLTHSVPRSDAGNIAKPNPVFVVLSVLSKTLLPVFVTLFGLAALTFFIGRMLPIDPVASILGDNATQDAYEKMSAALGMDKPLWYQFGVYVKGILSLDFGDALTTGKR
ncbi:putative oligopeptide ABC transporter permease protein [Agrobacterium rubi TR3 = NBRC 13261]|uniref:Putative oligopeptide ABC transporter permease protein n=1 Tax=Agrobacterium rubi TR3 = NBRC 13261 TaxID=1368415 RepID=A0A081CS61_9HYPH|nr:peptide/nickel transport system permease protein [Agrobacterium rubi]GAK69507.1 putative oligopeptide ABC transporter permease protein [Agrobacterium rubi TR3 = NBRC 13261]